jgi:hypothetical protein
VLNFECWSPLTIITKNSADNTGFHFCPAHYCWLPAAVLAVKKISIYERLDIFWHLRKHLFSYFFPSKEVTMHRREVQNGSQKPKARQDHGLSPFCKALAPYNTPSRGLDHLTIFFAHHLPTPVATIPLTLVWDAYSREIFIFTVEMYG